MAGSTGVVANVAMPTRACPDAPRRRSTPFPLLHCEPAELRGVTGTVVLGQVDVQIGAPLRLLGVVAERARPACSGHFPQDLGAQLMDQLAHRQRSRSRS